ncbi:hypothetical protein [Paenibacillus chungangensis]|uniref:SPOR domain-containing protein n=1 Tax=Paenibacillus chungangensis TaxID=696535 RepID=A0ABW3HQF3_9BACL
MLDKRSLLIGLGVGIILGASLYQLFSIGEINQEKLGRVGIDQSAEASPSTAEEAGNERDQPSGEEGPKQEEAVQDDPKDEKLPPAEQSLIDNSDGDNAIRHDEAEGVTDDNESTLTANERVIRIEPGFNLTETANLLASSGAIDNAAAFINEMKKQNKMVRAGYFLFSEATSIKEAVKIVTSEPLPPKTAQQLLQDFKP